MLAAVVEQVRQSFGLRQKQDIQWAARYLASTSRGIAMGDDCAAIADGDSYLLLAAEGLWPQFVSDEPWFAGWCGVMVNVSDIYAMGGTPIAVVDTLWCQSPAASAPLWEGLRAAANAYGVPIVGGHTNCHSPYDGLSVAILGRATHPISSFTARPGDCLMVAVDLQGQRFKRYPFWNAATQADPARLRSQLALLPQLAEMELCNSGKDISMGGVLGTALMLLEASRVGADLSMEAIPRPSDIPLSEWLHCFPSYGFLLSVSPPNAPTVRDLFLQQELSCEVVGTVAGDRQVCLHSGQQSALLWDFEREALTGFAGESCP
ncbi:sll0787 family AIR synthase-like protein [Synechococcus sp. PCC 7336]|uniref:sll0787 family AIR synthase-like protein n=1 Tax=Synechococcus sp. PCC 7336 TaxID=195250 RepID=UPI0003494B09|nr:sll0787 family AIR synthase-like protein [Synechococcus sp. PCC 7336]